MRREPVVLLLDAERAAAKIAQFIAGSTEAAYLADALLRSAVERQAEILGEALNALARAAPEMAAAIPDLSRAVAFRNLLIHGYAMVDDRIVWRVASEDIPLMRRDVKLLLDRHAPH